MNRLAEFIAEARRNLRLQKELEGCSLELWGDCHTPLDVDMDRILDVARRAGYELTRQDLIVAQCDQLNQFWRFEMENSFVARRYLSRVQYQLSSDLLEIDYYEDESFSGSGPQE
jgi:hypothetical protein